MFSENVAHSFYFVGIGGVSMSALAMYCSAAGARVRGSDERDSRKIRQLRTLGIPVSVGQDEEITEDTVIYTGAVPPDHPQLTAARRAGKRLVGRAQFLGMIAEEFPHVISVAGCHGKTSTTAMLAHIFYRAGKPFTCHIGGEDRLLGNYYSCGQEYFITEACEFQRSFLSLKSDCALVLNIDKDHTDCYKDENEIFSAFYDFASAANYVITNRSDRRARALPHDAGFGVSTGDYRAEEVYADGEKYCFTVTEKGLPLVRVHLNVVGKVQVENALAAFACARHYGLTAEEIKRGLESFSGVKRRFERVGTLCGVPVICDYAHHPREIAAVFSAAGRLCRGTVRLVFQPHTYTRTRDLMEEFVEVLKEAENPLIYRTYAAREPFELNGSACALVARLPEAAYVQSPQQLKVRLACEIEENDIVLVLGAGDIYEVALSILDKTETSD